MNLAALSSTDVLLVGVGGKTGHWYARLLLKHGHRVIGYDKNPNATIPKDILGHPHFTLASCAEDELLERHRPAAVTLSPGVPLSRPIFSEAERQGILVFSEVEFTAPWLAQKYRSIGITGTDGKSTTTALIAHILSSMGIAALACGNYGIPFSQLLLESEKFKDIRVLAAELSSYQLERCRGLTLDVAVYLNLAPDHLDRYASMADYCLAKWNIYHALRPNGTLVINRRLLPEEDTILGNRHPLITNRRDNIQIIPINTGTIESVNYTFHDKKLYARDSKMPLTLADEFALQGRHNLGNILFAMEAVKALLPTSDLLQLVAAAKSFGGLPHRYEVLPSPDGNIYINDSKATTTQAALTALSCSPAPIFMFLGGRGKGESYAELASETAKKRVICFVYGEEKENFAAALQLSGTEYFVFDDLRSAFHAARSLQQKKKIPRVTYLLAPAVTSWDQFGSFEERGDFFRSLVKSI